MMHFSTYSSHSIQFPKNKKNTLLNIYWAVTKNEIYTPQSEYMKYKHMDWSNLNANDRFKWVDDLFNEKKKLKMIQKRSSLWLTCGFLPNNSKHSWTNRSTNYFTFGKVPKYSLENESTEKNHCETIAVKFEPLQSWSKHMTIDIFFFSFFILSESHFHIHRIERLWN